ncbi:eukaryotic aspartyl protease family protein [Actinidia rufa]|uniref:Eukaryotic aspartyl protease family protein n=1 Tax=Actinidia rufa TaxID=165716 RepID=A0A7J0H0Z8_9ERIC|nr:eukaryotic aspartyl protease family protein [Actinidia rufa]
MEPQLSPQLKGVVIITLPPADNPSLGKTITAFTLSDSAPTPTQQTHQDPQIPIQSPPPPPNPQLQLSHRKTLFGSPRIRLGFLGISLIVLILWVSASPNTSYELRNSDDDDDQKPDSFIFPLYPKSGFRGMSREDIELKLGRFVRRDSVNFGEKFDDGMKQKKEAKLVSTESKIEAAAILPVRGNIYPDGLYFTYMLVGSPPKPYFLDVDTGSDLTWLQCDAPCTSCAKCDYEIEYADQSSSMGVLAMDEIHLMVANGSLTKSTVVFGCAYDQKGILLNSLAKTDGILGLSRAHVSLPSQLASRGIINNVVGHCLAADAVGGGYIFLGDGFVPHGQMAWVPMLNSPST